MVELDIKDFLKAEDVEQKGSKAVFITEGEHAELKSGDDVKKVFQIDIEFPDKTKKTWTMNKTSQLAISEEYGKDTKTWVNKGIKFEIANQSIAGTMRKVIYGLPDVEKVE